MARRKARSLQSRITKRENATFKSNGSQNVHDLALQQTNLEGKCTASTTEKALADKSSPLFSGCGSDRNYRQDSLMSHNTSKCHLACAKPWQKNNQLEYQPPIKKAVKQMTTSLDEKNRHHLRVLTNTAFLWERQNQLLKNLAASVTSTKMV